MRRAFPHRATEGGQSERAPSRWREFAFMLNQLKCAIAPPMALIKAIEDWANIRARLAEAARNRRMQFAIINSTS